MLFEEIVKIVEIMEIGIGDLCLRTKLQEVKEQERFTVFHPTIKGIPVPLAEGDVVNIRFYRSTGIFEFDAKVISWFVEDKLKLCMLEATTEVIKSQRRKSYRLPIVLKVLLWRADDTSEKPKKYKAKTVDISEHGMLLTCFESFEAGTTILAEVQLGSNESRIFEAEVLRCEQPFESTDPQKTVLLFVNCSQSDRMYLGRFILKQQILERKKRALRK